MRGFMVFEVILHNENCVNKRNPIPRIGLLKIDEVDEGRMRRM